jgi:hypothetical protein
VPAHIPTLFITENIETVPIQQHHLTISSRTRRTLVRESRCFNLR